MNAHAMNMITAERKVHVTNACVHCRMKKHGCSGGRPCRRCRFECVVCRTSIRIDGRSSAPDSETIAKQVQALHREYMCITMGTLTVAEIEDGWTVDRLHALKVGDRDILNDHIKNLEEGIVQILTKRERERIAQLSAPSAPSVVPVGGTPGIGAPLYRMNTTHPALKFEDTDNSVRELDQRDAYYRPNLPPVSGIVDALSSTLTDATLLGGHISNGPALQNNIYSVDDYITLGKNQVIPAVAHDTPGIPGGVAGHLSSSFSAHRDSPDAYNVLGSVQGAQSYTPHDAKVSRSYTPTDESFILNPTAYASAPYAHPVVGVQGPGVHCGNSWSNGSDNFGPAPSHELAVDTTSPLSAALPVTRDWVPLNEYTPMDTFATTSQISAPSPELFRTFPPSNTDSSNHNTTIAGRSGNAQFSDPFALLFQQPPVQLPRLI